MKISSNAPDGQDLNRIAQNIPKNIEKTDTKEKVVQNQPKSQIDKVDISRTGKEVADLMSVINQMPEVRDDKVNEIRSSLEAGTYTIDPNKIAEKMLKEI